MVIKGNKFVKASCSPLWLVIVHFIHMHTALSPYRLLSLLRLSPCFLVNLYFNLFMLEMIIYLSTSSYTSVFPQHVDPDFILIVKICSNIVLVLVRIWSHNQVCETGELISKHCLLDCFFRVHEKCWCSLNSSFGCPERLIMSS